MDEEDVDILDDLEQENLDNIFDQDDDDEPRELDFNHYNLQ